MQTDEHFRDVEDDEAQSAESEPLVDTSYEAQKARMFRIWRNSPPYLKAPASRQREA